MVTKEDIDRINELARKSKGEGLTDDEKKEQQRLRRLYVDSFKQNLQLELETLRREYGDEKRRDN